MKPSARDDRPVQPVHGPDTAGRDDAGSDPVGAAAPPHRLRAPARLPGRRLPATPVSPRVQVGCERRPRLPPGPVRGGTRQLSASPVLIGSVTILIAIVAVFISYQANNGLPFVPTYQLKAEMPNGAKLVKGNEVRAGGFRVGIVKNITSERKTVDGQGARDRRARPQAGQEDPAAVGGLDPLGAPALRARPEVRGADPGPLEGDLPGRRHHPAVARHAERARARGRALHVRAAHARRRAEVARGLRRLDRRPGRGDQHDDPRARAVHALPAAGDAQPVEPRRRS